MSAKPTDTCVGCGLTRAELESVGITPWHYGDFNADPCQIKCGSCSEVEIQAQIAAYQDNYEELDTAYEDAIICPHCGDRIDDTSEYGTDDQDVECGNCGREYHLSPSVSITYTTVKK
jgi:hypothetical protein